MHGLKNSDLYMIVCVSTLPSLRVLGGPLDVYFRLSQEFYLCFS